MSEGAQPPYASAHMVAKRKVQGIPLQAGEVAVCESERGSAKQVMPWVFTACLTWVLCRARDRETHHEVWVELIDPTLLLRDVGEGGGLPQREPSQHRSGRGVVTAHE